MPSLLLLYLEPIFDGYLSYFHTGFRLILFANNVTVKLKDIFDNLSPNKIFSFIKRADFLYDSILLH